MRALTIGVACALFPVAAMAQQPCTSDARHVVNEIYRTVLERSADRGSDTFVQRLTNGTSTVREVVRDVAKSPEHTQRFATLGSGEANERAVIALYRHILGREPDPDGLRSHTQGIASQGVEAEIDGLVDSDEYRRSFGNFGVPGSPDLRFCGPGGGRRQGQGDVIRRDRNPGVGTGGAAATDDARFDALDRNGNGRLERNEWNGTAAAFDRLDINGNNILSRAEVVGENGNSNSSAFSDLDRNRDGRLSIQEWNWNRRTFDQQDANGDGVITVREFTGIPDGGTTGR